MTGLIAIDPGYARDGEGCAVAFFWDRELHSVWFQRPQQNACTYSTFGRIAEVVVERPQQDERTYGIPPEVLATLSWEGAALAYGYAGAKGACVIELTPSQWKGSIAKAAHHRIAWKVLSRDERAVLGGDATWRVIDAACERGALARWKPRKDHYYPAGWTIHNLLDAVALGLTHLGRIRKP